MAQRPVRSPVWRVVGAAISVAIIVIAGETAISAGWAVATRPAGLGDKVVWAGIALGSAAAVVWFALNLLRTLGIRRG